jgi:hypothetical protein
MEADLSAWVTGKKRKIVGIFYKVKVGIEGYFD